MRHSRQPNLLTRGFTLIELLVVVIILAILAAIVIPQFSNASNDTQEAALDANLAGLRNAIELYKVQHKTYPGAAATSGGTGCTSPGVVGSAAAAASAAFSESLLNYSNAAGQTCSIGDTTNYKFGPYLRKGIPADPITQKADVAITVTGAPLANSTAVTGTTGGWMYDTLTGQIVVNHNGKDAAGKFYYQH